MNDAKYWQNYVTAADRDWYTFVNTISYPLSTKKHIMGNLLYIIAVILVIAWAIGFFAYSLGGIVHILLVIALIAIILRVIQGRNVL